MNNSECLTDRLPYVLKNTGRPVTVNASLGWSVCNTWEGKERPCGNLCSYLRRLDGAPGETRQENSYYDYCAEARASRLWSRFRPFPVSPRASLAFLFPPSPPPCYPLFVLLRLLPAISTLCQPPFLFSSIVLFLPFRMFNFVFHSQAILAGTEFPAGKNLERLEVMQQIWRIIRFAGKEKEIAAWRAVSIYNVNIYAARLCPGFNTWCHGAA